jgi:hypothetical protein
MKTGLPYRTMFCAIVLLAACGQKQISFKADVQPILAQYCNECHAAGGEGQQKSGLTTSSYEGLMQGTRFGAVVKPGDTLTSALIMLVEGRADPSIKMPHGKASLPQDKIEVLKQWVAQGAKNN